MVLQVTRLPSSLLRVWSAGVILSSLAGCAVAPMASPDSRADAPEGASGSVAKTAVAARKFMVAAANPHATHAGSQILRAGGSAVDAAIAVQMVLSLVEPQSSGIGGGAFMLHFDGADVIAFDGRETAPAAVDEHLFEGADGKPLAFLDAVGARAVGVPGVVRMLELAHCRFGKLPWPALFAPAIELAEAGFDVSPRLAQLLAAEPLLARDSDAAAYFLDEHGVPWPVGHRLKNPALAQVLRAIADGGADAFYHGEIARSIVAKVTQQRVRPGRLALSDLANYRAKERDPLCTDYKAWVVCGMPPPSSGGVAVAQMLGILAHRNLAKLAPDPGGLHPESVHLFAEAGRLAFADRARYVADTDFVPLPGDSVDALIDSAYLAGRADLIGERSMGRASAGAPLGIKLARGLDRAPELAATSHFSIVDTQGHAVSITTSIESGFGSRLMVRGFLLNNQLTDFSFVAADADGPVANRVQPGKRPRSAMAPTLVLDRRTRQLMLVLGSPGGPAIINYVMKVLVGTMDWGLNVQEAIDLPNFGSRNGPTELERDRFTPTQIAALKARGHVIRLSDQSSGIHAISRITIHGEPRWLGGADPRREGNVEGD